MNRKTLLFTSILLSGAFAWNYLAPDHLKVFSLYFSIIYFGGINTLIHNYLIKTNEKSPQQFIRVYLGSTALRLFLNLIVILIYILVDKPHAMVFAISFLMLYFIFLIFEIASLQQDLKKK